MTRAGRVLAAAIASFAVSLGCLLPFVSALLRSERGLSYAILTVDRGADDRALAAALSEAGVGNVVSESTEWVWIDDFGEWERVPLDSFRERVSAFDPRDTGYPELVRSFFAEGGERRLYLEFGSAAFGGRKAAERAVAAALAGNAYRLDFAGAPAYPAHFSLPLLAAALAFLVLKTKSAVPLAGLPALAALALHGPGGLGAAGFLGAAALFSFRCLQELSAGGSDGLRPRAAADYGLPAGFALLLFAAASAASGIPLLPAVLSLFSAASGVALLSAADRLRRRPDGSRRFRPVLLRPSRRAALMSFSAAVVPFAAASLCALALLPAAGSGARSAAGLPGAAFSSDDYEAHLEVQRTFLTRPVLEDGARKGYTSFVVDDAGMPAAAGGVGAVPRDRLELPPAERFAFGARPARSSAGSAGTAAAVLLLFAVSAPSLKASGARRKKTRAAAAAADKRIAA